MDTISGICKEYEVPPSAITIEVTESISKMDHEQLKELIQTINDCQRQVENAVFRRNSM